MNFPIRLAQKSLYAMIRNSIGSNLFRNFYCRFPEKDIDVMKNGALSCAFFVSSLTTICGLSERMHGTVQATIKDLLSHGWNFVADKEGLEICDVVIWEPQKVEGELHSHIGFYIGNGRAVSNSSIHGVIKEHDIYFEGSRKIIQILRHSCFHEKFEL